MSGKTHNGRSATTPEFAFTGRTLSRGWQREFSRIIPDIARIAAMEDMKAPDDLPEIERRKLEIKRLAAIGTLPDLQDKQEKMICEILVHVPKSWLIDGAPDDLDWSDPRSLDWLLADKFNDLIGAVASARAKN